jgi:hypothetical protein
MARKTEKTQTQRRNLIILVIVMAAAFLIPTILGLLAKK